jgi:hypothetical protein
MGKTKDLGHLAHVIVYDASNNITLPANLTVNGTIIGYATTAALSSYVPTSRTITINGTTYDLTANRNWDITSMIYPAAGIALSTGSAWGTSITNNSANWNTAFGWGNHASAGYATTSYVNTQVANLVASAPAALDTLNELAAALGNDAAFSTTVSTALGNRLRVDINNQGLSATLQGYGRTNLGLGTAATSATGDFAAASHTHSIANVTGLQTALDGKQASGSYAASVHSHAISDVTGLQTALDGKQASLGYTPYNSTNPAGYITSSGSISGNAATATNSTQWNGAIFNGQSTRFNGDINTLGLSGTSGVYNLGGTLTNSPSTYGTLYAFWNSDISTQFYVSYNGSAYWRQSVGATYSGSTWKTFLDSSNYTSYAVPTGRTITINGTAFDLSADRSWTVGGSDATKLPLTGGTLTGGISITGQGSANNTPSTPSANIGVYAGTYAFIDLSTSDTNGGWIDFSKANGTDFSGRIRYANNSDSFQFFTAGVNNITFSSTGAITASNFSGNLTGNVTGTATYATQLSWTGAGATIINANAFGPGILSNYYGGGQISNIPEGGYGSLINFGGYNQSSLALQLYSVVNHNTSTPTRTLYFRMGNNLGFGNDWHTLLDNYNYPYPSNMNQYVRTTDNVSFARVDSTNYGVGNAIYFGGGNNYFNWTNGRIYSNVGIETAGSFIGTGLTINTGGTGTWGPFVVTSTSLWGDGATQYVTIGAGGAAGIMIYNPHIVWNAGESMAAVKFGRSGGVSSGVYYVTGTGASDNFFIRKNAESPIFNINSSGNATFSGTISASNLSGTNTGDQTNISGNAATATNATNATNSTFVASPDGDRVAGNKLPTGNPRAVRFDFATAGSVSGATGNYAGVMTYAPWDGTSASTGDSSYQLAFINESGVNASGVPGLRLRNGINSTWNGWTSIITSSNIGSQSVNFANTATNATNSTYSGYATTAGSAPAAGGTATALNSSNYISQRGSQGSWNADFQNTPAGTMSYGGDVGANGSSNPGGSWWIQENFRHTNSSNYWGVQVAWGWEDNANRLATRNVTGGSFGGWVYYMNTAAYPYAANMNQYVRTTDSPTFSSVYTNDWIRMNTNLGLYCPGTNGAQLYANNGSYGPWKIEGFRNSYGGWEVGGLSNGNISWMVNQSSNTTGFHNHSYGWQFYWENGTLYVGKNSYGANMATVLDSSNYTGYAAGVGAANTWTAINYFQTNNGGRCGNTDSAKLQAYSTGNNSAFMSFHKSAVYAVNIGLDDDNVLRIGGWSASANRFQMDMSGNLTMAGDVTAYSDARVKTNIKTIENALNKVLNLRGVSYNRTDSEDRKTKIGVIAQETLPIVPEVVNQDNDGMYNVSYGNFGGLFIEAFKEQQKQIEELKNKLDLLTNNK